MPVFENKDVNKMSREEINVVQRVNCKNLFMWLENFPNYIRHYSDLKNCERIESLQQLPILEPEQLGELLPPYSYDLVCDGLENGVVLQTGGTSSKPKVIYHTWKDFRGIMELGKRGLLSAVKERPKRIANCLVPGSLWGGFLFGQGVAEVLQAQIYPFGNSVPQKELINYIKQHKIDCLFLSPSFAVAIFSAEEQEEKEALKNIEQIFYVGEALTVNHMKKITMVAPDIHVRSLAYSSNETGPIGYQCLFQQYGFHHINEDCVIVEIVNPDTSFPVKEGETGDVVVTTLCNAGTPLLRYRIGDRAKWISTPCQCGSQTRVLELKGRTEISVKICGLIISTHFLNRILGEKFKMTEQDYQLVISSEQDRTFIELLLNEEKISTQESEIAKKLILSNAQFQEMMKRAEFGSLTVTSVSLSNFKRSGRTGKAKVFIRKEEQCKEDV